jgi:hypothetical protein
MRSIQEWLYGRRAETSSKRNSPLQVRCYVGWLVVWKPVRVKGCRLCVYVGAVDVSVVLV